MSPTTTPFTPKEPVKLVFQLMFVLLILAPPAILWAFVKKFLPAKQKSVKGQVILITGAAGGLGRELAKKFARLGGKIVCVDINEVGNDETARTIKEEGGVATSYKCDISKRDQIKDMHEQVKKKMGPVDILINNAAVIWGHIYVDPIKDQLIDDIIDVNIKGQFRINREILPSMLSRNSGHIVAVSSLSSMAGIPGISSYTASKWATNGMMECLRNELNLINRSNIKITTVLPYFMQTNPEITERLDIRFPEIPIKLASSIIVKGILEEKTIFSVPYHLDLIIAFGRLLPDYLLNLFHKIIYVRFIWDERDQLLIDQYTNQR